MELTLHMNAEEAVEVTKNGTLKALAESLKAINSENSQVSAETATATAPQPAIAEPATSQQTVVSVAPTTNVPAGAPVGTPSPQTPAPQPAVPTETKSYTADELQKAAIALMDKGVSMDDIAALLGKHGVSSLPELTPDKFGAFALDLRQLGADI